MTTEIITFSEYRKNLSSLWKKWAQNNIKYLVMVHGKPSFEVTPVKESAVDDDWTEYTPENHKAWLEARRDRENWELITLDFEKIKNEEDFFDLIHS